MDWFNYYGLAIIILIMIPNVIYAMRHKIIEAGAYTNKIVTVGEQIGRYGSMIFMVFNIPYTYLGFWFHHALIVYLSVNGGLCIAYLIFWIIYRNKNGKTRALSLSVTPSCIFIFCGIVTASIPLLICAVLFTVSHVTISYKNAP